MTESDLRNEKSVNFDVSNEEWQKMFLDTLFGRGINDVQLSALVGKDGSKITLNVQKIMVKEDLDVIPVRIGRVNIPNNNTIEIDLIQWLTESSQAAAAAQVCVLIKTH